MTAEQACATWMSVFSSSSSGSGFADFPADAAGDSRAKNRLEGRLPRRITTTENFATEMRIIAGVVGIALLIASVNIASLLLARTSARQKKSLCVLPWEPGERG